MTSTELKSVKRNALLVNLRRIHENIQTRSGDMESAIKTLVTTFLSSAKGKESLDSKSFQKMVQKNLSGIMEDTNSASAVKEMHQGLDDNSDGKVSFTEYLTLIGYIANSLSQKKTESNASTS